MMVGEAPGLDEELQGVPFVGYSGQELRILSAEAGIDIDHVYLTNVLLDRPPDNKLHDNWCVSKREAEAQYQMIRDKLDPEQGPWPKHYTWASLSQGQYLLPKFLPELFRLKQEILLVNPNLVVALGGTALWALMGAGGISKLRGAITESTLVPGQKILPAWHPSYVQRAWQERSVLFSDLVKAKREMEFPDIRRPHREIWTEPTIEDLYVFRHKYLQNIDLLAFDTETAQKQITCISFAPNPQIALTVPFVDRDKPEYNYWSATDEVLAWKFVTEVLGSPVPKLAQNGLYDLQYLWFSHGIAVRNFAEDTMLRHHTLYLEMKKDLGFLGSVYTDEAAWKLMRTRAKDDSDKKDD